MRRIFVLLMAIAVTVSIASAQATVAIADKPALLTSIGQSADFEMVKVLLNRAKVPFTTDAVALPSSLPGAAKTLILSVGGSSKGLGAAGISVDDEMARAKALIKRAKDLGMKIIVIHVGGEARRGTLSDIFIELCVPAGDLVIVVEDGDKDGLFEKLAAPSKIAVIKVPKITAAGAPLAAAFK
ncbi:MAG: hypothetical protein E4H20_03965 [Spirochaetales bacterium]|nr:MAG: hypothetical protein E4H20_03965 [Spirochaetales bacterium]